MTGKILQFNSDVLDIEFSAIWIAKKLITY